MKKFVLAIAVAYLAVCGIALADDYMDNVGVYFDTEATDVCLNRVADIGISQYHVYTVLTELTSPSVKGFELGLAFDGPLLASNFVYPAGSGALNMQSEPTFLVGFAVPIPAVDRKVVVMEFDILVYSVNPVNWDEYGDAHVFVKEIFFHSLPDPVPAYLTAEGEIKPLHQSTGLETNPVMIFSLDPGGCGNVVASDETTWDSLKSLYR